MAGRIEMKDLIAAENHSDTTDLAAANAWPTLGRASDSNLEREETMLGKSATSGKEDDKLYPTRDCTEHVVLERSNFFLIPSDVNDRSSIRKIPLSTLAEGINKCSIYTLRIHMNYICAMFSWCFYVQARKRKNLK